MSRLVVCVRIDPCIKMELLELSGNMPGIVCPRGLVGRGRSRIISGWWLLVGGGGGLWSSSHQI